MALKTYTHAELVDMALIWSRGPLGARLAIKESSSGIVGNGEFVDRRIWGDENGQFEAGPKMLPIEKTTEEVPDVWGWIPFKNHKTMPYGSYTFQIECKASRSDFLADKKKMTRKKPEQGAGQIRWFYCPPDIVSPDEIPENWGLVTPHGRIHKYLKKPKVFEQDRRGMLRDFTMMRRVAQEYSYYNSALIRQIGDLGADPTIETFGSTGYRDVKI